MRQGEVNIEEVLVDLTNHCNYNCKFCGFHSDASKKFAQTKPGKKYDFPSGRIIKLIEEFEEVGVENIVFTAEGEPSLHPGIKKIAERCSKSSIRATIQTNGSFDENIRESIALFDEVHFNLSFFSDEAFEKLQQGTGNRINEVKENILYLKSLDNGPLVRIIYIINNANFKELNFVVSQIVEWTVDEVEFKIAELIPGLNEELMLSKKQAKVSAVILLKNKARIDFKHNIDEVSDILLNKFYGGFVGRDYYHAVYFSNSDDIRACFNALCYLYIRLNGDVQTCSMNRSMAVVGNVFDNSVKGIIESEEYKKWVKRCVDEFDIDKKEWFRCRNCPDANFQRKMLNLIN